MSSEFRTVESLVPGDVVVGLGTVAEWPVPVDLKGTKAKIVFDVSAPGTHAGLTMEYPTGLEFAVTRTDEVALEAFISMMSGEQDKALSDQAKKLVQEADQMELASFLGIPVDQVAEAMEDYDDKNIAENARLNVETIATAVRRTLPEKEPTDMEVHAEMTGDVIDGMSEMELKAALYLATTYLVSVTRDFSDEEFHHMFNCNGHHDDDDDE